MAATYGAPYRTGTAWFIGELGSDGVWRPVRITGPDDKTYGEPTPYNSQCGACWLGFAHSGAYHRAYIL